MPIARSLALSGGILFSSCDCMVILIALLILSLMFVWPKALRVLKGFPCYWFIMVDQGLSVFLIRAIYPKCFREVNTTSVKLKAT